MDKRTKAFRLACAAQEEQKMRAEGIMRRSRLVVNNLLSPEVQDLLKIQYRDDRCVFSFEFDQVKFEVVYATIPGCFQVIATVPPDADEQPCIQSYVTPPLKPESVQKYLLLLIAAHCSRSAAIDSLSQVFDEH